MERRWRGEGRPAAAPLPRDLHQMPCLRDHLGRHLLFLLARFLRACGGVVVRVVVCGWWCAMGAEVCRSAVSRVVCSLRVFCRMEVGARGPMGRTLTAAAASFSRVASASLSVATGYPIRGIYGQNVCCRLHRRRADPIRAPFTRRTDFMHAT